MPTAIPTVRRGGRSTTSTKPVSTTNGGGPGHQVEPEFGNDYLAGGAAHDVILGQLGDDVIQGDGTVDTAFRRMTDDTRGGQPRRCLPHAPPVAPAAPGSLVCDLVGPLTTVTLHPHRKTTNDGEDYVEGNAGNDVVFGREVAHHKGPTLSRRAGRQPGTRPAGRTCAPLRHRARTITARRGRVRPPRLGMRAVCCSRRAPRFRAHSPRSPTSSRTRSRFTATTRGSRSARSRYVPTRSRTPCSMLTTIPRRRSRWCSATPRPRSPRCSVSRVGANRRAVRRSGACRTDVGHAACQPCRRSSHRPRAP